MITFPGSPYRAKLLIQGFSHLSKTSHSNRKPYSPAWRSLRAIRSDLGIKNMHPDLQFVRRLVWQRLRYGMDWVDR
jgi:hypothetical protein